MNTLLPPHTADTPTACRTAARASFSGLIIILAHSVQG